MSVLFGFGELAKADGKELFSYSFQYFSKRTDANAIYRSDDDVVNELKARHFCE